MGKTGKFKIDGMKELQKQLSGLNEPQVNGFMESCVKELAARLLSKAIKRTPVGVYPMSSGKKGGTLRRGWSAQKIEVKHVEGAYTVEIINPVEYASYVEFGHRTANHGGWVEGQFMLTISEQELETATPAILEKKLRDFLGGALK